MKNDLSLIAREAGKKILNFYDFCNFKLKEDLSPLTEADEASHNYLVQALNQVKNIPILSEENYVPYEERCHWHEYWMIDPLDGTKEFLSGFDDFCLNISLMKNNQPVLGLIYAPVLNELYYADEEIGFQYEGPVHIRKKTNQLLVARSRFHNSVSTEKFLSDNNLEHYITIGAAVKFGRMALGLIDLYPRFEGSKEWDIAAGDFILQSTNCYILDLTTKKPPLYNKITLKNNFFFAANKKHNFKTFQQIGVI